MKIFFSDNFLNHVTFWCQITNTGNRTLKIVNLVSSNTKNISNIFLTDVVVVVDNFIGAICSVSRWKKAPRD